MKKYLSSFTLVSLLVSLVIIATIPGCTAKYKQEEQVLGIEIEKCQKQLADEIAKEKSLQKQLADLKSNYEADKARNAGTQKRIDDLTQQLSAEKTKEAGLQKQLDVLKGQEEARNAEAAQEEKSNEAAYQQLIKGLKDEIKNDEISIHQYKDIVVINIAERVLFDLGRAEIKTKYYPILDKIGKILKGQSDRFIQIEGHTDDVPIAAEYQWKIPNNWALGARRAINVTIYFMDHFKIDPSKIGVMSFSKYRPLFPNISAANRAKNRRIEIILLGKKLYNQLYKKGM
jgi:chemotaxis protein MotB